MSLYEKLIKRGAISSLYKGRCDYRILEYNEIKFYFKLSQRKDFEGKPETHSSLIALNLKGSDIIYRAEQHVRVFANVVLFRSASVNDAYTQTFLRSMWGKFILMEQDIYRFKKEGFQIIVNF